MITLSTEALAKAIAPAAAIAPQKSPMEIVTHLWIEAAKGLLRVGATNMESWIETRTEANGDLVRVYVDADLIRQVVQNLPDDSVTLSLTDKQQLEIKTATSLSHLQVITDRPAEAMAAPSIGKSAQFLMTGTTLANLISKLLPFTSHNTSPVHASLDGVWFSYGADGITMAATDRQHAGLVVYPGKTKATETKSFVIAERELKIVDRYFRVSDKVTVAFGEKLVSFSLDDVTLVCTIIDADFPPVATVTDRIFGKTKHPVTVSRMDFIDALKRKSPFLPSSKAATFSAAKGRLTIASEVAGRTSVESIATECDDDVAPTVLSVSHLLDMAQQAGTDRITIHMGTPKDPIYLQPMYEEEPKAKFSAFAQTIVETNA